MELLERYMTALQAALPAEKAAEICREIEANILDELASVPPAAQETQLITILQHYGAPKQLALTYAPAQPLIAAEDMPLFWELSKVLLALVASLQGLAWLFSWLAAPDLRLIQGLLQYAFATAHMAAIGFALLCLGFYWSRNSDTGGIHAKHSWHPTDLPEIRFNWQRIPRTELIQDMATIVFATALLWPGIWLAQAPLAYLPEIQPWRIAVLLWCALALELQFWWLFMPIWSKAKLRLNLLLNLSLLLLLGWGACYNAWLDPGVLSGYLQHEQTQVWSYWTRQSVLLVIALVALYEIGRDYQRWRKLR